MDSGKDRKLIYREIEEYINALKARNIHVIGAYLFGSYVKGKADEWSDIDVAILTDRFIGDSFDFRFMLTKIVRDIDLISNHIPILLPILMNQTRRH